MDTPASFSLEEWALDHPRMVEVLECLTAAAPEQLPFVQGSYFQNFPCHCLVALQENRVVGLLQFAVLPIGPEIGFPPVCRDGQVLVEAKIHLYAVHPGCRGQGIGTALQRYAIRRARELGCYQLASYSAYGREANYHVKLSLGFAVQPEIHGEHEMGVYFVMPLQSDL
jgi:GNAT superfamily N-acetyltransferase